jgi:ribosome-associated toxin RatA of RatAB toxin-antitoxin module
MHTSIGIDVSAPPELVFALARDVARWERLLPHYARSRSDGRTADGTALTSFIARRPLPGPLGMLGLAIPVAWRSRTWSDDSPLRLRFVHVAGATKGMDVTWTIEPAAGGTRVDIHHEFRRALPIPVLGPLLGDAAFPAFVDRWFTRPIAGRTLATFKALAEAVASTPQGIPPLDETSAEAARANLPS